MIRTLLRVLLGLGIIFCGIAAGGVVAHTMGLVPEATIVTVTSGVLGGFFGSRVVLGL